MSEYYLSLRDYMAHLKKTGDLIEVSHPVSTHLEMTEIQTRLLAKQGPAVLFKNPYRSQGDSIQTFTTPVLINLYGTVARIASSIHHTPEELRQLGYDLAALRQMEPPKSLKEGLSKLKLLKTIATTRCKTVRKAPCQELVFREEDINLNSLPIQGCWPNEPAPLITWPLVVTQGPNTKKDREDSYNLGIYRLQQLNERQLIVRWLKHRGGASHFRRWCQNNPNTPFPMAIVLGADPATTLSAVMPIPDTLSEYDFSGLLRKKSLALTPCKSVPLKVPAHAEIIIEGYVSPTETHPEGPYGDHTGYYNAVESFPVFTATALTSRKDPIYLSTFTGRPPDEPSRLGEALNELFIPLLQQQFPEVIDCWLLPESCSYRIAVVSIKKSYPGQGIRVMQGLWSFLRQFLYTKWVIVVDEDINARVWEDVVWALSTRVDPARDIHIIEKTPIDYLDFASVEESLGGKVGIDATNKIPPETHREWGQSLYMSEDVIEKVTQNWANYGFPPEFESIWKKS